jgi:hypothetical protein
MGYIHKKPIQRNRTAGDLVILTASLKVKGGSEREIPDLNLSIVFVVFIMRRDFPQQ